MPAVDLIIIGGGPAGLFAASQLNTSKNVLVLEKNESAGKKLLLSGSGRCNLTHDGPLADFFNHYGDNQRFLKPALHEFSNQDLWEFFHKQGVPTSVDKNGKVFPAAGRARDVLELLLTCCRKNRITVRTHEAVTSVAVKDQLFQVVTKKTAYTCTRLLIATGGKSYPTTGSSGDGYLFAAALGHTIVPPRPALVPVIVREHPFAELAGISLPGREIALYRENRKLRSHCGDLGFTPSGLTGPGILDFSRYVAAGDQLKINLVNEQPEVVRTGLLEAAAREGELALKRFLKRYGLPEQLLRIILAELSLDSSFRLAQLTKERRNRLVELLCAYPLLVEKTGGFDQAMVTSGGVALAEVATRTMASLPVPGLYFAGEVLDIDGDTGGYNLQAAFSTGYLAARALARSLELL